MHVHTHAYTWKCVWTCIWALWDLTYSLMVSSISFTFSLWYSSYSLPAAVPCPPHLNTAIHGPQGSHAESDGPRGKIGCRQRSRARTTACEPRRSDSEGASGILAGPSYSHAYTRSDMHSAVRHAQLEPTGRDECRQVYSHAVCMHAAGGADADGDPTGGTFVRSQSFCWNSLLGRVRSIGTSLNVCGFPVAPFHLTSTFAAVTFDAGGLLTGMIGTRHSTACDLS